MRFHFNRVLDGAVRLGSAEAGTHLLGWLRGKGREFTSSRAYAAVARAAADDDLVLLLLSRYCLMPSASDALVLGYGGLSPRRIAAGVEQLARTIDQVFDRGSRTGG